ncbi:MAG: glycosyltransferase family 9 protein [Endomicrobia bacterium]|nr:glycosyltransferase family 9 protein [Endomicrobiia bacterium]
MKNKFNYKQNCLYFKSDRPCIFHKQDYKVICDDSCKFYTPINKKILIIKLGALGDVVRTTSILKPLHKRYKNSKFFWVTYDEAVEVFNNNPYVTEVIPYSQVFTYFGNDFDILINLDLEQKSLELTKKFKCVSKYGFYIEEDKIVCSNLAAKEWFDISHNDMLKKKNKKTYQQYMLEILGFKNLKPKDYPIIIKLSKEEKQFAAEFLKNNNIDKESNMNLVGINLGGGEKWEKKEYPIEQTVKLIKFLVNKNLRNNTKILLFGGKREINRNAQIMKLLCEDFLDRKVIDTGCNNTLRQFFSLIDLCDLLITTDTLALHVALGLNKKVICLFGPTSFNEIEMYGLGEKVISPKKCRVCYKKVCKETPDCMYMISPTKILNMISKLLG